MKRVSALTLLAAAAVARPLAAQPAPVTVRIGVQPAEVAAGAWYAHEHGDFTTAGLVADIQNFSNGAAIATAVAGGSLDVGLSDLLSVITGHAHGLPFVYVAPGLLNVLRTPTLTPVVSAASGIATARDFNGKTVAVNGINNIAQIPFQAWIDRNGGDSKSVKFIELPYPSFIPALARGTIDGFVGPEPFVSAAVKAGNHAIFTTANPIAPAFLLSGWVATTEWVAKNPVVARRFANAIRAAGDWANTHPAESAPILSANTKIPLEVIAGMRRGFFQDRLDPAVMQPIIDVAARYGVIEKPFPAAEIIATIPG